jgi:hypothetical protein
MIEYTTAGVCNWCLQDQPLNRYGLCFNCNAERVIKVDLRFNNAGVRSSCGICGESHKPAINLIPFLTGTWVSICDDCLGSFDFEIMEIEISDELRQDGWIYYPALTRCASCGNRVFREQDGRCYNCPGPVPEAEAEAEAAGVPAGATDCEGYQDIPF